MADTEHIQLAHGGGGELTGELIEQVILPALGTREVGGLTDGAVLHTSTEQIVFTTDTYVVRPLEFPGGDIGKLAVCGTVNDLAVMGAVPRALSMGLVIREGLEIALLKRILESAGEAARQAAVEVVTGDTKVVNREGCDGLIINTAGVGELLAGAELGFDRIQQGDRVVLSGALGEHGLAVMSLREGLNLSAELDSDCAPVSELTQELIERLGSAVHFMRDPTRGGLAATLVEVSRATRRNIEIEEEAIPVNRTAVAVAEMLGLDLLSAANEGKLVAVVDAEAHQDAVAILRKHEISRHATVIGTVGETCDVPLVEMITRPGGRRIVQMPYGEELPRIC